MERLDSCWREVMAERGLGPFRVKEMGRTLGVCLQ